MGLPQAFLVAGVPCVVESQWSLKDEPNSKLMKRFYKEMSQGSDIATAIRAAMLSMKPEKGSPVEVASSVYEWGGYLVWGLPTVTLPPSMLKCSWLPPKPISRRHRRRDDGIHGYNGKHKELWSNHHIEKWIYALFLQSHDDRKVDMCNVSPSFVGKHPFSPSVDIFNLFDHRKYYTLTKY